MSIQTLTQDNFDQIITENPLVLVDFWSHWCGPCRIFSEIYQEAAKRHPEAIFGQVNIEEEPELAKDFNVRSIPFLMVFRKDVAVYAEPGALTLPALEDIIQRAKALDISEIRKSIDQLESTHINQGGSETED